MKLKFTKMQGIGNDYIYFNCFEQIISDPEKLSIKLSDRHFGIGGDGIVLILPSKTCDVRMRMFNADGSEGKMCGNAIRCIGKFVYERGIVKKDNITVETLSGTKYLKLFIVNDEVTAVEVDMGAPVLKPSEIPVKADGDAFINKSVIVNGSDYNITCVSMGNPHAVIFTKGIDNMPLGELGPHFENHSLFPERINTEFVEIIDDKTLKMRVWERGSGETLACGTGACAVACAACLNGYAKQGEDITVKLIGGELKIRWDNNGRVYMKGPAAFVFDGETEV